MEGEDDYVPVEARDFYKDYTPRKPLSPEIVEVGEDSKRYSSFTAGSTSRDDVGDSDVYVAVGKDDTEVLKWVLDNAILPGSRVFLVYVFPRITHIPTPVGKLSKRQLSEDQVRFYINDENNKRRNILQKYVYLCNDAKVTVDTMLLESNDRAKAIVDLIPVLRITHLVLGTKRPPHSRRMRLSLGQYVSKNAPEFCQVSIIHEGKNVAVDVQANMPHHPERSIFEWACMLSSARKTSEVVLTLEHHEHQTQHR